MAKKPRRRPRVDDFKSQSEAPQEFINCSASGCPNIISSKGYSGQVYCALHLHLAETK